MIGKRLCALLTAAILWAPGVGLACPCVDTVVVRVDDNERRLVATISETSRVMVTAALWELLLTEIQPSHPDWIGQWHVSFFTSAAAAQQEDRSAAASHVADYDRARRTLILWPGLEDRREVVTLEIQ